jgi:hypothetical protein
MMMKIFLNSLIVGLVFTFPLISGAEQLVPCEGTDCNFCHIVDIVNRIVQWVMTISTLLVVLVMAVAGWRLITSGGDASAYEGAKKLFYNAVIGVVILLAAWTMIDTLAKILVKDEFQPLVFGPWNSLECGGMTNQDATPLTPLEGVELEIEDIEAQPATSPVATSVGAGVGAAVVVPNDNMNPLFTCQNGGCSSSVRPGAEAQMQAMLSGPFAVLQNNFGRPLIINDALAKAGTSRESATPGSRHFYGDALDISLAGMSNADRIRLFETAQAAGFNGFGFGNNILHIDLRSTPTGWAYGNTTYGGRPVSELISQARR